MLVPVPRGWRPGRALTPQVTVPPGLGGNAAAASRSIPIPPHDLPLSGGSPFPPVRYVPGTMILETRA
jgi:hypothetical protein